MSEIYTYGLYLSYIGHLVRGGRVQVGVGGKNGRRLVSTAMDGQSGKEQERRGKIVTCANDL